MKICTVIGARPQFIKHAALAFSLKSEAKIEHILIHTGQHYDVNMSQMFFEEFNLEKPDYILDVHSQVQGEQTSAMQLEIENILADINPDYVIVYGDTNSTLAGAKAAKKLQLKLVHIEAGLRSFNMAMPEEVNRILTDHISDILFAPSQSSLDQLANEGLDKQVEMVGDIMKDMIAFARQKSVFTKEESTEYYYATIHRPYNTDDTNRLKQIFDSLNSLDKRVVFSLHPRTRHIAAKAKIDISSYSNIEFNEPVSYFQNLNLIHHATALLTDSGGMQKEAYWLKTRCITLRKETEWTETLAHGWNLLLFEQLEKIETSLQLPLGPYDECLYGDGRTAEKIIQCIKSDFIS